MDENKDLAPKLKETATLPDETLAQVSGGEKERGIVTEYCPYCKTRHELKARGMEFLVDEDLQFHEGHLLTCAKNGTFLLGLDGGYFEAKDVLMPCKRLE